MEHNFTGPSYTLGIEEELMIVERESWDLVSAIEQILDDSGAPSGDDRVLVTEDAEVLQRGAVAGLRAAEDVALAALLEVDAGELEPVAAARQRFESPARVVLQRAGVGDQQAKTRKAAAARSSGPLPCATPTASEPATPAAASTA